MVMTEEEMDEQIALMQEESRYQVDTLLQVEELIRAFTKEWNKESTKRVSRVAMDELISYLRVNMKERTDEK